jgi:hypothetical protein
MSKAPRTYPMHALRFYRLYWTDRATALEYLTDRWPPLSNDEVARVQDILDNGDDKFHLNLVHALGDPPWRCQSGTGVPFVRASINGLYGALKQMRDRLGDSGQPIPSNRHA